MKLFATSFVVASFLMTGTAFAQEETKAPEQVKVEEAKEKLVQDKQAGAPKEQIKSDRKELKKARHARREMKKKLQSEKQ